MRPVRILHVSIAVPLAAAYGFAREPISFTQWAGGFAHALHRGEDGWVAETPLGQAAVRFTPPNDHGVLDHTVLLPGRPPVTIPLRMIADGEATLVELVLFRQPDMDDAAFEADVATVRADLDALKALLERRRRSAVTPAYS